MIKYCLLFSNAQIQGCWKGSIYAYMRIPHLFCQLKQNKVSPFGWAGSLLPAATYSNIILPKMIHVVKLSTRQAFSSHYQIVFWICISICICQTLPKYLQIVRRQCCLCEKLQNKMWVKFNLVWDVCSVSSCGDWKVMDCLDGQYKVSPGCPHLAGDQMLL